MATLNNNPGDSLEQVASAVRACVRCRLHETRTNGVPGVGSVRSQIVFVGEGPGRSEDELGEPFVGRAGKLLDQLLASVSILREDVFITNIVKCRPPANRDPKPDEIGACAPYLKTQLDLIKPKVIATLGRHALEYFIKDANIGRDHGRILHVDGISLLPLYHPAAGLRSGTLRERLFEDFKQLPRTLRDAIRRRAQLCSDAPTVVAERTAQPTFEQNAMF